MKIKKILKVMGIVVAFAVQLIGVPIAIWFYIREHKRFKRLEHEFNETTEAYNKMRAKSCCF